MKKKITVLGPKPSRIVIKQNTETSSALGRDADSHRQTLGRVQRVLQRRGRKDQRN